MHCQWIVYSYTKSAEFVYFFGPYAHVNSLKNHPSAFFSFKMKHKQQQLIDTTISENNFENEACKVSLQFMLPENQKFL